MVDIDNVYTSEYLDGERKRRNWCNNKLNALEIIYFTTYRLSCDVCFICPFAFFCSIAIFPSFQFYWRKHTHPVQMDELELKSFTAQNYDIVNRIHCLWERFLYLSSELRLPMTVFFFFFVIFRFSVIFHLA